MTTFITALSVMYLLVGICIYVLTDTTKFARRLERSLVALPYGAVMNYMFLFVVLLWPLWLAINGKFND